MKIKETLKKTIALLVSSTLILPNGVVAGSIVTDTNAAKNNQAIVEVAPNNVPVVNIVKPNASGLSHNKFIDYNVNKEGVILNNSNKREVNTQLSGYIYGNKNLSNSNTASTILNEVTSRNKTQLKGYTEVAGDSAHVILANPNGILVNGAGFINTPKITITTGTPNFSNKKLQGYDVEQGSIEIDGENLNLTNVDKAELYSKIVKINTKINAKDINIVSGRNSIDVDGNVSKKEDIEDDTSISIDSTILGGIYANKISLIGTQDGVGVNLPIEIFAQDTLSLSADGKIVLEKVNAKDITITSSSNSIQTNELLADDIKLKANNTIINNNVIATKNSLEITANKLENKNSILVGVTEQIEFDDTENINANLNINSSDIENINSNIIVKNKIDIKNTNKIVNDNKAKIVSLQENIEIDTKDISLNDSSLITNKSLNIKVSNNIKGNEIKIQASDVKIQANDIELTSSNITATSNDLNITSQNKLNLSAINIASNNSNYVATNDITVNSQDLNSSSDTFQSNKDINITSTKVSLNNTDIQTVLDVDSSNNPVYKTENAEIVLSQGDISIDTNSLSLENDTKLNSKNITLENNSGKIQQVIINNSSIEANNDISILTKIFNSTTSLFTSVKDIVLDTDTLKDVNGNISLTNTQFKASSTLDLKINDDLVFDSTNVIEANNNLSITSNSLVNNASIKSNANLTINTNDFIINNALLSAKDYLTLTATNTITNNDSSNTSNGIRGGITNITTNNLVNNSYISSLYDMNINSTNLTNYGGIASGNSEGYSSALTLNSANLTNYNTIYSNDSINLFVKDNLNNITDNTKVSGLDYAKIYAQNNIIIQANEAKTLRTNSVTNDKAVIETGNGDINIFANSFKNLNDEAVIKIKDNPNETLNLIKFDNKLVVKVNTYTIHDSSYGNNGRDITTYSPSIGTGTIQELENKYSAFGLVVKYNPPKTSYLGGGTSGYYYLETQSSSPSIPSNAQRLMLTKNNKEDYFETMPNISTGAKLVSGNNINLDVDNGTNYLSLISANNNIETNITNSFINSNEELYSYDKLTGSYYYKYKNGGFFSSSKYRWADLPVLIDTTTKFSSLSSTVEAGGSIIGDIDTLNNGEINENISELTYNYSTDSQTNTSTEVSTVNIDNKINNNSSNKDIKNISLNDNNYTIPTNKYGIFVATDPNINHNYLVESNPLYTNLSNFTGSAYFLEKLDYKADKLTKRLGDAAYETQLVRDSIIRQTGQRIISTNFSNDNEQYVSLMNNAINLSAILNLEVGVPPTIEQLANLTEDIVWMEYKIVNGEKVLVPQVYLYNKEQYKKDARITAQNTIDLKIKDEVSNQGVIKAGNYLSLDANKITNNSGVIFSKGTVNLIANNDIINKNGGNIKASQIALTSKEGSVMNETNVITKTLGSKNVNMTYTQVSKTSNIEATDGNLIIQAKKDITNLGASLKASNSISLTSQEGNIDLKTKKLETAFNYENGRNFNKSKEITYLQSNVSADKDIVMNSGKEINLESVKINVGNTISLNANEDVNITAVNTVDYKDTQTHRKKSFGRSKTQRDMTYTEEVLENDIKAGNNIIIKSNKSVTLEGVSLEAENNILVDAKEDVNVLAKQYRVGELHLSKKSGLGGLSKSISLRELDSLVLKSSELKTQAQNIILKSGEDIDIIASNIDSAADVQLEAFENLMIASQEELYKEKYVKEKTKFNLASAVVGVASGGLIDAGAIYTQKINNKDEYTGKIKSSNIKAGNDILASTGSTKIIGSKLEANNDIKISSDIGSIEIVSAQELEKARTLDKTVEVTIGNVVDLAKGLVTPSLDTKIKLNIATATYDKEETVSQGNKNVSSNLNANNGDLILDSSEDIVIEGSNIQAAKDIVLSAQSGDITIKEAIDSSAIDKKETQAKAEVNITVQNEYVEIASAVKAAAASAKQLKEVKEAYSNYKRELKQLKVDLSTVKENYKNKIVAYDKEDIEAMQEVLDDFKDDEKYQILALAAATADLASKTVAIAQQTATAAASSGTAGFSAGISLDVEGSKTKTNENSTQALTSKLNANNIYVKTDKEKDTSINISGSDVIANETIVMQTKDLNVKASQSTYNSNADTESINGSISKSIYGVAGGGPRVSLGYGEQHNNTETLSNNNTFIQGKNVTLDVANDANFIGANVQAEEKLAMNVGNDLTVESLRDISNSKSNGFNVSGGFSMGASDSDAGKDSSGNSTVASRTDVSQTVGARTGNGEVSSANALLGVNSGNTKIKQTVLSTLTGNEVEINVNGNTNIKGALVASGEFDEIGNFIDNEQMKFKTNTLTFTNNTNSTYSTNNSLNGGVSVSLNNVNNKNKSASKVTSSTVGLGIEKGYKRTKTLATLGKGDITIIDEENSDDLSLLNTNTQAINKTLTDVKAGTSLQAVIDQRMFTEDGQKEIKQEYKDMDKNMKTISETLPSAISDNPIEAAIGEVWDSIAAYGTFGILPSNGNNGGLLGEIPILSGNKDSVHSILQVVSTHSPLYQKDSNSFIAIEKSDAYKQMSEEKQSKVQGLFISVEPVEITKDNATYQNGGNGMMNSKGLAVYNVLEQTGMINQYENNKEIPVEASAFYNPSRGIVADLLESAVDTVGGLTGIAKQHGEFNVNVTTTRGADGVNMTHHSQNNLLLKSGINYINSDEYTGAKFKPASYFATGEIGDDNKAVLNTPSYVSFGSPVPGKVLEGLIETKVRIYIYGSIY